MAGNQIKIEAAAETGNVEGKLDLLVLKIEQIEKATKKTQKSQKDFGDTAKKANQDTVDSTQKSASTFDKLGDAAGGAFDKLKSYVTPQGAVAVGLATLLATATALLNKFKEIEEAQLSAGQAGAQSVASVFAQTGAYTSGATKEEIQQAQKILQGSPGAFTETERANIFKSVQDQSKGALSVLQAATLTGKISSQYGPVVGGNAQAAQDLGSDIGALMSTGKFTQEEAEGQGLLLNQAKGAQAGFVQGTRQVINTLLGGSQLGDAETKRLRDQIMATSQVSAEAGLPAESLMGAMLGLQNKMKQQYTQAGVAAGLDPASATEMTNQYFSREGRLTEITKGVFDDLYSGDEQRKKSALSRLSASGEGGAKLAGTFGGQSAQGLQSRQLALESASFGQQTETMQELMPQQSRLESARALSVAESTKKRE
jgi:hypothetical protein